jgi:hypothetical protein
MLELKLEWSFPQKMLFLRKAWVDTENRKVSKSGDKWLPSAKTRLATHLNFKNAQSIDNLLQESNFFFFMFT